MTPRPRRSAVPVAVRIGAGLLWLSNAGWKMPPDFGRTGDRCRGLCSFVNAGIEHGPPGWSTILERIVAPNLALFGYGILFIETALAATLLAGVFVRPAALVGIGQSIAVGLSVANAPGEWYWSYALMVLVHLAVLELAPAGGPPSRRAVGASLVVYGLVVAIANSKNDVLADDFTRRWVWFGGDTDFPGDFGRNVFAGSIAIGIAIAAAGLVVVLIRSSKATRVVAVVLGVAGVAVLAAYRAGGGLLGARAAVAGVLVAAALALRETHGAVRPMAPARAS